MLQLANEQTNEHCKYFKFKSHFFNRRWIEYGFKAMGGKYHDLKGFHWKNIRTDRQPYLERTNVLDTDQTNGHYSHSEFLMHATKSGKVLWTNRNTIFLSWKDSKTMYKFNFRRWKEKRTLDG